MIYWWEGYIIVKVRGNRIERLINRMMSHRLSAWDMVRTSEDEAQFSIVIGEFLLLRSLLKETGCRTKIIHKAGLPFLLRRMRRRTGLYGGAIAFALLLYVLSSIIWSVQIEGVQLPENQQLIRQQLAELGVKPGAFKFKAVDGITIKETLMDELPGVTWVGFKYTGTVAHLKVIEKTLPDIQKKTNLRHLVAKKKAIVHDFFVEKGQSMVKLNQYVKPGDILISGIIGTENKQEIVSATGQVFGEVWYESNISVPFKQKRAVLTGDEQKSYYVKVGSIAIKLWGFGKIEYEHYKVDENLYPLRWKNWVSPIAVLVKSFSATEKVEVTLSEHEAIEVGLEMGRTNLYQKLQPGAELKEENVLRKRIENGKVYIKMHYTVIEEITREQLLFQGD
jgi:similar to stage IV sporulation protein